MRRRSVHSRAVIDGELHTPELDGTIQPGVTRDSLITLSRHLGYRVIERTMAIDELLLQLASGACSEVFACGTAAIVCPISVLADSNAQPSPPANPFGTSGDVSPAGRGAAEPSGYRMG